MKIRIIRQKEDKYRRNKRQKCRIGLGGTSSEYQKSPAFNFHLPKYSNPENRGKIKKTACT